jgi:hypothetical protein
MPHRATPTKPDLALVSAIPEACPSGEGMFCGGPCCDGSLMMITCEPFWKAAPECGRQGLDQRLRSRSHVAGRGGLS